MRATERILLALIACVPAGARAATPPECGPDCGRPGRYLVCNDGLDTNPMTGGVARLNAIEWVCAAFTPPTAAAFTLEGAVVLFAPTAGSNPAFFEQRVYANLNTAPQPPLPQLMPVQLGALQISATAMPSFFDTPLNPTYTITGDFRMCFLAGLDDSDMGFVYDGDGIQPDRNYISRGGWREASMGGVTGDFVIRASVVTTELAPWGPGGECEGGADAGVRDGGPARPDAAPRPDAAGAGEDASTTSDDAAAGSSDGAVGEDARAGEDAASGPGDAGAGGPPPTITSISPNRGNSSSQTPVLVSGTGFAAGAVLKIGAIGANDVRVPGSTTLEAVVPPGIVSGVHDVIVQNPDGQAAVLVNGFTVISGAPPAADGCSCASGVPSPATWLVGLFAVALLRSHRRRSRDGRSS